MTTIERIHEEAKLNNKREELQSLQNNLNKSNFRKEEMKMDSKYNLLERSASSDNDLSFSLAVDREVASINSSVDSDELPAFEIRLLSPMGCTPSPIDFDQEEEDYFYEETRRYNVSPCSSSSPPRNDISKYVTVSDIDAQISPPSDYDKSEYVTLRDIDAQISPPSEYGTPMSRNGSLETIYEDVFLNTTPRPHSRVRSQALNTSRSPRNLLEKIAAHRFLQGGKQKD